MADTIVILYAAHCTNVVRCCLYTGSFIKSDIIRDVDMTETKWSRLMKLSRLNGEQYKNYSSKFE